MEETEANSLKIDEESVVKGHQEPEATLISDSLVPASGMTFNSEEELYDFFKSYAVESGFGITKKSVKSDNGQLKYYALVCVKYGNRKINEGNTFNPRPSMKSDCKAKINVRVSKEGSFIISRVQLEHNHELSPKKARFFRSSKNMNPYVKRRVELLDEAGVPPNKKFHSLVIEAGGYENLTFTERECRNHIAKARQYRLGQGDGEALLNYFLKMQRRNPKFFYIIDMDEESCLRNIFWADARSIVAYESFGDVVSFDTTYLTNRYDMPFAPFVGVNHHGQTILFGCGLLSNEDTNTYIWLFNSWLECMSGVYPKAIITDQCKAIGAAIAHVFPNSHHRLCLWHIMRKIPEKLSGLTQYKPIKKNLKAVVYESVTVSEFEETWAKMIKDHSLESNVWLNSLYDDRHRWIPAYIKGIFWAGMSTTQRSESLNAFFDGYVGSQTSLKQFVEQYDNALKSKTEKENKADFVSFSSTIPMIAEGTFEKQFQEAYTNHMFSVFQDELRGMIFCNVSFHSLDGSISKFLVEDVLRGKDNNIKRHVVYDVYFNEVEFDIRCSCRLFEFKGILCRHVTKVLLKKDVKVVPAHYILDRWRKDIKHRHSLIKNCYDDFQSSEKRLRYNKLCSFLFRAAEIGSESEQNYDFVVSHVEEAIDKLMKLSIQENMDSNNASMECNEKENVPLVKNGLRTPLKVRRKGRPPSTRRKSTLEKIIDKTKRSKRKVIKEEQDDPSQNGSQSLKKKKVPPKKKQPSSSSTTLHSLDELGTQESLMVNSNDNEVPVTGSRK